MQIEVDILNSLGVKIGDGPLSTARDFRATAPLSRIGRFSFSVAIADPHLAALVAIDPITDAPILMKKIARVRGLVGGTRRVLGAGIIDKVTHIAPDRVQIEGDDLLREWRNLLIWGDFSELEVIPTPAVFYWNGSSYITVTAATNVTLAATNSFFYVGYTYPFNIINVDMGATVNAMADSDGSWGFSVEGADPIGDGWREPVVDDGTRASDAPFAQDGDVEFQKPANWVPLALPVDGIPRYYMRFDPGVALTPNLRFNNIDVSIRSVIVNDIQELVDRYNALVDPSLAWSLTGYTGTTNGTLKLWAGETFAEALVKIHEQTGENFRLTENLRELEWLRNDWDNVGYLRAVQQNSPYSDDPDVAIIESFEDVRDSYKVFTRVYATGAGNGEDAVITLSDTTRSIPGYTIGTNPTTSIPYLEKDDAVAAWGVIEEAISYPDIGSVDGSGAPDRDSSNALYDASKAQLDTNSIAYRAYKLSVVGLSRVVLPGTQIGIVYRRLASGAVVWRVDSFNVDGQFVVMTAENETSEEGLRSVGFVIANVARHPKSDSDRVVDQIRSSIDYKRHPQGVSSGSVR